MCLDVMYVLSDMAWHCSTIRTPTTHAIYVHRIRESPASQTHGLAERAEENGEAVVGV